VETTARLATLNCVFALRYQGECPPSRNISSRHGRTPLQSSKSNPVPSHCTSPAHRRNVPPPPRHHKSVTPLFRPANQPQPWSSHQGRRRHLFPHLRRGRREKGVIFRLLIRLLLLWAAVRRTGKGEAVLFRMHSRQRPGL